MHEIGILCQVIKEVEKVAAANGLEKVDGVVLEIGELTGIQPVFFETYYDMVTEKHPVVAGSKLILEIVEGKAKCRKCGEVYNVPENDGFCPACKSFDKVILSGRNFMIKEIIISDNREESA